MAGYMQEFSRRGNFIWYYSFAYDEYELQHVSIGTLMTVSSESLYDYRNENDTVEDALWYLLSDYLLQYFIRNDGVGQRCILRKVFTV